MSSSWRISSTRARLSRVSFRRDSVSRRRSLYLGNSRRFLQENAQIFRARLDDARDHALFDDGVGARPQAGAEEHVGDVAASHVQVVDVILRFAVAVQHPLDADFGILRPLPGRLAQAVVEFQLHAGARHRLARGGAVENHVLHGFAAQRGGAGFAQHPAHSVDHIGFAAAVGADHAHPLSRHRNGGGVDEGLEAGEFDVGEAQES